MTTYHDPLLILSSRKLLCFSENMAGIAQKSVYMKQREKKKKKPKCPQYLRQGHSLAAQGEETVLCSCLVRPPWAAHIQE